MSFYTLLSGPVNAAQLAAAIAAVTPNLSQLLVVWNGSAYPNRGTVAMALFIGPVQPSGGGTVAGGSPLAVTGTDLWIRTPS